MGTEEVFFVVVRNVECGWSVEAGRVFARIVATGCTGLWHDGVCWGCVAELSFLQRSQVRISAVLATVGITESSDA